MTAPSTGDFLPRHNAVGYTCTARVGNHTYLPASYYCRCRCRYRASARTLLRQPVYQMLRDPSKQFGINGRRSSTLYCPWMYSFRVKMWVEILDHDHPCRMLCHHQGILRRLSALLSIASEVLWTNITRPRFVPYPLWNQDCNFDTPDILKVYVCV